MIYGVGDKVVVNVNGTYMVGVVTSKNKVKRGWTYSLKLENGKTIDSSSVNKDLTNYHISKKLTTILNNDN
jgi:hypothetical protein